VNNNYEFRLYNDGNVGISKWLDGEYVVLVDLKPGGIDWSSPHHVTVTCKGNQLSMQVDGNVVVETTDDSFASGGIALSVFNPNQEGSRFVAAFDNFEAAAPSSGQQAAEGQTVFYEDFANNNRGWSETADTDTSTYLSDGRLFLQVNPVQFSLWIPNPETPDLENIVINVDVNIEQATHDGDIGVLCRYRDADNHYALEVSEDGYYTIWKRVNGEVITIVEWAPSDLIPTDGSPFVVNASCNGAQLSVGINGNLLATGTDTDFSSGNVGMIAGTWVNPGLTVSFDNFEVIEY
jgi:hypothetical protein